MVEVEEADLCWDADQEVEVVAAMVFCFLLQEVVGVHFYYD